MSGNNSSPRRSVLEKATSILDAFAGNRVTMTLSDLARATGLPASTVHRLVGELVAWGGLERTEDGGYAVGLRLWEIATRSRCNHGLREVAMPYLQDLFDLTRQHVQLAVIDGNDVFLIEKISDPRAIETVGRSGGRLPLHATAIGKALLAASGLDFQADILGRPLMAYTPRTVTAAPALSRELAEARDRGFALSSEELTVGVVSCASGIVAPGLVPRAAISVVMPANSGPPRRWAHSVTTAAAAIGRALVQQKGTAAISAQLTGVAASRMFGGGVGIEASERSIR
ncbi:IclR family transcriptional regulator [Rhodococcus jostii]|uniref:IclR family transcriptional regulator n=1 Tax=Rhodococcus jostii TaxID=132919 RepID=A0ABU4C977_RHOJO|nr:IclR family transcriptional regulator [Rhodococcus jostii]MDV6280101.1 IclR family transcriptional regulator [Rhodococcus jostii]